jgi:hypothetical protein
MMAPAVLRKLVLWCQPEADRMLVAQLVQLLVPLRMRAGHRLDFRRRCLLVLRIPVANLALQVRLQKPVEQKAHQVRRRMLVAQPVLREQPRKRAALQSGLQKIRLQQEAGQMAVLACYRRDFLRPLVVASTFLELEDPNGFPRLPELRAELRVLRLPSLVPPVVSRQDLFFLLTFPGSERPSDCYRPRPQVLRVLESVYPNGPATCR